jgi:hypothetical protein
MTRRSVYGVLTALTAATLLAGAPSAAAAAPPDGSVIVQPFAADSGDDCPMGYTNGQLTWGVVVAPTLTIRGLVGDQPVTDAPRPGCADDGRFSAATFTAYIAGRAVGSFIERVDNGERTFVRSLSSPRPVDVVTVQVCRHSPAGGPITCGALKRYLRPVTPAAA